MSARGTPETGSAGAARLIELIPGGITEREPLFMMGKTEASQNNTRDKKVKNLFIWHFFLQTRRTPGIGRQLKWRKNRE